MSDGINGHSWLWLLTLAATTGCLDGLLGGDGGQKDRDDTATTGETGEIGETPAGSPGWRLLPLPEDTTDPNAPANHTGNSGVVGIHFRELDRGVVVVTGQNQTRSNDGAIFAASDREVGEVLFRGSPDDCIGVGNLSFVGLTATESGYVALAHACDLVSSEDGGASFVLRPSSPLDRFGIEQVHAWREIGDRRLIVRGSGVISSTEDTPGPNAVWQDLWAPGAIPSIPNPVPADQCQEGPKATATPTTPQASYISEDGQFIAYAATNYEAPSICISTDGGISFYPRLLEGAVGESPYPAPIGIFFTSSTDAIAWQANYVRPDQAYIYRTTDGGESWQPAVYPPELSSVSAELRSAFFAPGGRTGFIVGFDYDQSQPLLIKTTDGGETWFRTGGDLAAKVAAAGGGKLTTGFALDEQHIWVGGEYGILAANDAGGQ